MKREIKSNTIDGTILKSLHVKAIEFLKLVMPTTPLIQRYEELISPFHSKMAVNNQQSQNLAPIRDTLLPELVSGELRVSDAEKRVAGIE
jgi:type I restriction enzyme, S subunit